MPRHLGHERVYLPPFPFQSGGFPILVIDNGTEFRHRYSLTDFCPRKHDTLLLFWLYAGPASTTPGQHYTDIRSMGGGGGVKLVAGKGGTACLSSSAHSKLNTGICLESGKGQKTRYMCHFNTQSINRLRTTRFFLCPNKNILFIL